MLNQKLAPPAFPLLRLVPLTPVPASRCRVPPPAGGSSSAKLAVRELRKQPPWVDRDL